MDNKFKVGDRVRGINAHDGNEKIVGELGTIIYIFSNGDVSVKFDKGINGHSCNGKCEHGHGWDCPPDALELVAPAMAGAKIIIFTQGNKVSAKLIKDKETLSIGYAHCSPDDVFNFLTGAQIALARLGQSYNAKPVLLKEALKDIEII